MTRMPADPLAERVIWITGASSGLGEALARECARRGALLVLSGRRRAELERVAASCAGAADTPMILPLDVSRPQEFAPAAVKVQGTWQRIDVLINNAGISQRALVAETLPAVERAILEVNFFGAAGLTRAVLPVMQSQKSGTIVAISSVMGHVGTPKRAAYAASKHAMQGWFNSLREEVRPDGVRVLLASPGYVQTRISENALRGDGSSAGPKAAPEPRGIPAELAAEAIVRALVAGRDELVVGGRETWAILLQRISPALYRWFLRREIARGRF